MKNIALIACSKRKVETDRWVSAWKLYTGQLFRAQFDYARFVLKLPLSNIFILSAGYGLVESQMTIETYDISLNDMTVEERWDWAKRVGTRLLAPLLMYQPTVIIMAGKLYREPVEKWLRDHWNEELSQGPTPIVIPHPTHLGYGQQVQWYKQQLEDVK